MNWKTRKKEHELKKALKELLVSFDADQIFDNLVAASENTTDIDYLKDAAITYLQIYENMNMVKIDNMNQQIEFEAAIQKIMPYHNQQYNNLFLKL